MSKENLIDKFLKKRKVLGLIERVKVFNNEYKAKIDTGADSSSIDKSIIEKLNKSNNINIVPISHKKIKSALGIENRPVVEIEIELLGKKYTEKFTVSERSNLRYKILIGKDILKKEKFLIDPNK